MKISLIVAVYNRDESILRALNSIKSLPEHTKISCGHEYTQKNLEFCITFNHNTKYIIMKKLMILILMTISQENFQL